MTTRTPKQEAIHVTLVGMWLDIALGGSKIVGGIFTSSFALITDGIHSLTDATTDIFVIIMAHVSHAEPDREHPWGHGRFETLGTIGMGIVFFVTAGILLYDSIERLRNIESLVIPGIGGALIALVSVASKEWIYRYTLRVAQRLNSSLLKANAWHSRTDAFSSIAVFIGLIAAQQGYAWMDTVAGMFVALIIAKIGWDLCADSLRELVDTAIPESRRRQIESCILDTEGILGISQLRSRLSGGKIILELHMQVSPRISVSEAHQLGHNACDRLLGRFSDIADVIFHIDPMPAKDAGSGSNLNLAHPERTDLLADIRRHWDLLLKDEDIESVGLHYFDQGVEVDLTLNLDEVSPKLMNQLRTAVQELDYILCIRIFRKIYESPMEHKLS